MIVIGLLALNTNVRVNDFYLNISKDKVEVDTTEKIRVYSLLETESLKEDWIKTT